jgi:hypothetical protein
MEKGHPRDRDKYGRLNISDAYHYQRLFAECIRDESTGRVRHGYLYDIEDYIKEGSCLKLLANIDAGI